MNKRKPEKKMEKITSFDEATKLDLNLRVRVPLDTNTLSAGTEPELTKVWKL